MDQGNKVRPRIGIIFNFAKGWLGGVYYVLNIIKSLQFLEENDMPHIFLFYKADLSSFVEHIQYPFLTKVPWKFVNVYEGVIKSFMKRQNIFLERILDRYDLSGIYPLNDFPLPVSSSEANKTVIASWIADLQHKFYPEFFTRTQRIQRELRIRLILKNGDNLVVSSHNVSKHFEQCYDLKEGLNIHVLQFVSIIDDFNFPDRSNLLLKYDLPDDYFIVSNQFLKHKNHIIVLKALNLLKKAGVKKHIVITGKIKDYKKGGSLREMKRFISSNQLDGFVTLTDLIPRKDQLGLLRYSNAIIQPSLFEGWSTVIEDAKSLQVPVVASSIDVNLEQLRNNGYFFNPHDEVELAKILGEEEFDSKPLSYGSYSERVEICAQNFLRIFEGAG